MTAVSLVIGTFPTQMTASPVTVTPWVPSAHFVSLRGASVSVYPGWGANSVTLVAVACMV